MPAGTVLTSINQNTGTFGSMSNSSHQNRNMSPSISNIPPASGGYMGQGLSFVGKIEPNGYSEANSTSFYSNNTSTISNNLNNSRYNIINRNSD